MLIFKIFDRIVLEMYLGRKSGRLKKNPEKDIVNILNWENKRKVDYFKCLFRLQMGKYLHQTWPTLKGG